MIDMAKHAVVFELRNGSEVALNPEQRDELHKLRLALTEIMPGWYVKRSRALGGG